MRNRLRVAAAMVLVAVGASAQSQVTMTKPVRLVVTASPGGLIDTLGRGITQSLTTTWGQPVIVESRPGANNIIGADTVAKSAPDGSTLLLTEASAFVANPQLYKKLPYNVQRDFTPITTVAATANVIAVSTSLGVNTLAELIAKARANPGSIAFGSTGAGSFAHIAAEQLNSMAGMQLTHVAYKGSAPLHIDLAAGHVGMYVGHISNSMVQLQAKGKIRFLASTTRQRLPQFPGLPTASEAGVPGFEMNTWFGLAAPANLPPALLTKMQADILEVVRSAEFQGKYLAPNNLLPLNQSTSKEFADFIEAEAERWKPAIKSSGATLD